MRTRLLLREILNHRISVNYNYALSSVIYKLLQFGSPEFSDFLHNIGFKNSGKTYKLFSYALRFNKFKVKKNSIRLINPTATLLISSPLIEKFLKNVVLGTFKETTFELVSEGIKSKFIIEQIDILNDPELNPPYKFKMISPVILSTKKILRGKQSQYYLRYNDDIEKISRVMTNNLANKYELIHQKPYCSENLRVIWDNDYISKMEAQGKRITRKVSVIKDKNIKIDIIGNNLPFTLEGPKELIKVGYDSGFGEKNSLGFGLAEIISVK